MIDAEFQPFAAALSGLGGILGRRIPAETAELYFRVLHDVDWLRLRVAIESLARRIEPTGKLPSPRDLRALTTGDYTANEGLDGPGRQRIFYRVHQALDAWEAEHSCQGPMRPVFERTWRAVLWAEGKGPVDPRVREACWQEWLQAEVSSPSQS